MFSRDDFIGNSGDWSQNSLHSSLESSHSRTFLQLPVFALHFNQLLEMKKGGQVLVMFLKIAMGLSGMIVFISFFKKIYRIIGRSDRV